MRFLKYHGAGNDFLIADNRNGAFQVEDGVLHFSSNDGADVSFGIAKLCDRRYGVGADGLMLLERAPEDFTADFRMSYFNSDGSGGMMCGNGGRCIVAFAADCGITSFDFVAADGMHTAEIVESCGKNKTVRLRMSDVADCRRYASLLGVSVESNGCFLDTGTRHYVRFVKDLDKFDVVGDGAQIRWNAHEFLPLGVNVNFVEYADDIIYVRTYEKGVEGETFACGTGIVASCLASYVEGFRPSGCHSDERITYKVKARRDGLIVDFRPAPEGSGLLAEDVWLTGPAEYVAEILI